MMEVVLFDTRFKDALKEEEKKQTIRRSTTIKVGEAFRVQTNDGEFSKPVICACIKQIQIGETSMSLNGRILFPSLHSRDAAMTDNEFARCDGFEDFTDMRDYIQNIYGLPFEGVVIYWGE